MSNYADLVRPTKGNDTYFFRCNDCSCVTVMCVNEGYVAPMAFCNNDARHRDVEKISHLEAAFEFLGELKQIRGSSERPL